MEEIAFGGCVKIYDDQSAAKLTLIENDVKSQGLTLFQYYSRTARTVKVFVKKNTIWTIWTNLGIFTWDNWQKPPADHHDKMQ